MPPRIMPADERLMAAYTKAALRIQRALQDASPRNRRVILNRVDTIVRELDELTAEYIDETLPLHFRDGSDEAVAELRRLAGFAAEIDEAFGTLHEEALRALSDEATLNFANALQGVRDGARSAISRAQKEQIVRELIASEAEGASAPSKRVKVLLERQGITAVQGRRRNWSLEDYSSMLTHTVLAEAHNTGAATRYAGNGVQYVRIIERADAPDRTCRWMRGKVVFLGDRRLLNPYHPNCMGGFTPVKGQPPDAIKSVDDRRIPAEVRSMLLKRV